MAITFYESAKIFKLDTISSSYIFEIYKEGTWKGNLNLIITDLNYNVDNRGILEDLAERRSHCG